MMTNHTLKDGAEIHVMNVVNLANLTAFKHLIIYDFKKLLTKLGSSTQIESDLKEYILNKGGFTLVVHKGKLIACFTFTLHKFSRINGSINDFVIADEWHDRGVEKILIEQVLALGSQYDCKYVELVAINESLVNYNPYESSGFILEEGKFLYWYQE